ncbi:MAG: hypothetical protein IT548_06670 [Alphaproteobacteria bacterium]|nr:hypothetical protein [Alphaproteobacteria bacterium]
MKTILRAALAGGFSGGAIDLAYAMIASYFISHMMPDALLRVIAGGLFGRAIIADGGLGYAALGAVLHFGIAVIMALAFCGASSFVPILLRFWFVSGPLYGAVLYLTMNYVVLPLSALAVTKHPEGWRMAGELVSHMAGVGPAIALSARLIMGRGWQPTTARAPM